MYKKIIKSVAKNFKILTRSKGSSLIVIIAPLILIILAGLAFSNTRLQGIKIGIYQEESEEFEQTIIQKLDEKSMQVIQFNTKEQCISSVKNQDTHLCMGILKKGNSALSKIDERLDNSVVFHVDYSNLKLVYMVLNIIKEAVVEEARKVSNDILEKFSEDIEKTSSKMEKGEAPLEQAISYGRNLKDKLAEIETSLATFKTINITEPTNLNNLEAEISNTRIELNEFYGDMILVIEEIEANFGVSPITIDLRNQIDQYKLSTEETLNYLDSQILTVNSTITASNLALTDFNTRKIELENNIRAIKTDLTYYLVQMEQVKEDVSEITTKLDEIKAIKFQEIIEPVPITYEPIHGSDKAKELNTSLTYLDYFLPALTILVIMFVAISSSAILTIRERKNNAYLRNVLSPTKNGLFLFSTFLTCLIIVIVQVLILFIISNSAFNINIASQGFGTILLFLFLITSIFIFIGLILGYLFSSEETTVIAAISVILLFLLFSGLLIPIETMPIWLSSIMKYNPLIIAEISLRKILIFKSAFSEIIKELVILLVYSVVFISMGFIMQIITKYKEI